MSQGVLYVGGIPGHLSDEYILSYFKQYSAQARVKIVRYPRRSPKCDIFGFLTIPVDIMPLIQNREHILANKKLIFEEHLSDEKSILIKNSLKRRRLFVRGIKKGITDADLFEAFSSAGDLESAYIIKDQLNNKSRSFGYVTFRDESVAFELAQTGSFLCKGVKLFVHPFLKNSAMMSAKPNHQVSAFQMNQSGHDSNSVDSFQYPSKMGPGSASQDPSSELPQNYKQFWEHEGSESHYQNSPQLSDIYASPPSGPRPFSLKNPSSPDQMKSKALYGASLEYRKLRERQTAMPGNPQRLSPEQGTTLKGRTNLIPDTSISRRVLARDQLTDESDNRSSVFFKTSASRVTQEDSSEYVYRIGNAYSNFCAVPKPTQRVYFGKVETKLLHEEVNLRFNQYCSKGLGLRH